MSEHGYSEYCNIVVENDEIPSYFKDDLIQNTTYSKSWIISLVTNILYGEKLLEHDLLANKNDSDLCTLWDMSTNIEVAKYLNEINFVSITLHVLENSKNDRLMEILIGIVGNLMCFQEINHMILKEHDCSLILQKVYSTDSMLILQVIKCILNSIKNSFDNLLHTTNFYWSLKLIAETNLTGYLSFILKNNLNVDVLEAVIEFIYIFLTIVFDETSSFYELHHESITEALKTFDYNCLIESILESIATILQSKGYSHIWPFIKCLNVLSIFENDQFDENFLIEILRNCIKFINEIVQTTEDNADNADNGQYLDFNQFQSIYWLSRLLTSSHKFKKNIFDNFKDEYYDEISNLKQNMHKLLLLDNIKDYSSHSYNDALEILSEILDIL